MNQLTIKAFDPIAPRMQSAGFDSATIQKELSFAVQAVNRSPQLSKCDIHSVLGAVLNIANIGLSLNPAKKECYLIPRWNSRSKKLEAVLEPSYIGLSNLAMKEGVVKSINTQLVYENDEIEIDLANSQNPIKHKANPFGNRGEIKGCYSIATLSDGSKQPELMSLEELHRIRETSEGYKAYMAKKVKSCTWVEHEGEMMRKTVLKRITKYLPKESGDKLQEAIQLDNQGYKCEYWQQDKIFQLLAKANITPERVDRISREYETYTYRGAQECIAYLEDNQLEEPKIKGRSLIQDLEAADK